MSGFGVLASGQVSSLEDPAVAPLLEVEVPWAGDKERLRGLDAEVPEEVFEEDLVQGGEGLAEELS